MRRIEAYGVVCELGCIADARGKMPEALKSPAEWRFFQDGLDRADVTVLGRLSHEVAPNPKLRRRLVLTGRVRAPETAGPETVFWNPAGGTLGDALALFGLPNARQAAQMFLPTSLPARTATAPFTSHACPASDWKADKVSFPEFPRCSALKRSCRMPASRPARRSGSMHTPR